MKTTVSLAAVAVLGLAAAPPSAAQQDDELEVTMEVLDELGDLDRQLPEMRGPRRDGDAGEPGEEGDAAGGEAASAADEPPVFGDDFEHDDGNDEFDDDLLEEGDFEDGEEVDDDTFDEEQHEQRIS